MYKSIVLTLSALVASTMAHMKPDSPCMRGSPLASCGYSTPDYSLSSPIGSGGSANFPLCHHTQPYPKAVATFSAGSSIPVSFAAGGAIHGGGHCEFSLSYDGGQTFVVIQTILKTCFLGGQTFSVPIPQSAPSGSNVVFAWSWVNAIGNREFYMTCSDIAITGSAGGSITGPPMITPNYGSGPTIGEFGNGGDDGSQYYTGRTNIVVTGSGGSSPAAGSDNSSAPGASNSSAAYGVSAPSAVPSTLDTAGGAGYPVSAPVSAPVVAATSAVAVPSPSAPVVGGADYIRNGASIATTMASAPTGDSDYSSSAPAPVVTSVVGDSDNGVVTVPTPSSTGGNTSGKGSSPWSCESVGISANVIVQANDKRFTVPCSTGLVCLTTGDGIPYCGFPAQSNVPAVSVPVPVPSANPGYNVSGPQPTTSPVAAYD
ncbi:hypothetical protein IWQ60_011352 [Tieghemiomyces parasiticus]|uniref:Uncharacterized protein n=1 Tax=Tieghemiomyces parasiticus TaxID=78921 RepID=A0A9W7ZS52_9FUNG|nr:hypothetical protein IWQ60_011352 [Tieghemiomyces parasiticus]